MRDKGKRKTRPAPEPVEKNDTITARHGHLFLTGFLFLALILRITALVDLSHSVYFDFLLWDERVYHEWAKKIADGTFVSRSVYEFAPLFAYITAFIYKMFSPDIFHVRVLNIIFCVLICWLIYLIGTTLSNKRVGLFACLIACLYKPFIFYSIVPLKESLSTFLFALTVYLFAVAMEKTRDSALFFLKEKLKAFRGEKPDDGKGSEDDGNNGTNDNRNDSFFHRKMGRPYSISTLSKPFKKIGRCPYFFRTGILIGSLGIAAGLLINVRPNAVVILPVIPLFLLWYAYRNSPSLKKLSLILILYIAGISVALSPFVIRNYLVAGKVGLTTTQTGFNLYLGNNPGNPDPYYRPDPFASSSPFEQGIQFTIEASRRAGKSLSSEEASRYWTGEVLHMAMSEPAAFAMKVWQKTLVLFNRFEACDHYDIDFIGNFVRFFKFPFIGIWLILPLGLAGMLTAGTKNRTAFALSAILGVYALTLIIFFTNARYRLPMVVILIPFAVSGLERFIASCREKNPRHVYAYLAVVTVFAIIAFLPVRGTDDRTAYYNTHAIILDSKGFPDEAVRYWKMSSDMHKPFSAFANLSLAGKYAQKGNIQEAHSFLEKIRDDSFAAAFKYELMGDILIRQRKPEMAIQAYETSLKINSGLRIPRTKLIHLYRIKDPEKAVQEEEKLKYINSFYDLM